MRAANQLPQVVTVVSGGQGRTGSRWCRAAAECLAYGELNRIPCFFCQLPVDYELTRLNHRHRLAATVHHIHGLAQGGHPTDPANLVPAHRHCNCRDGAVKLLETKRQPLISPARNRNSRRW
jgi:hypothetical protein